MKKLAKILSALAILIVFISQSTFSALAASPELFYTPLFNDANIISYYRLEGNSTDAKGTNSGTDTNITYSTANGKFNQGAGFNGTDSASGSRITSAGTTLNMSGDMTLTAWINSTSFAGVSGSRVIIGKGTWVTNGYNFMTQGGGVLCIYRAATGFCSTGVLSLNTWTLVSATITGTTGRLYVNGSLVGSPTAVGSFSSGAGTSFTIGIRGSSNNDDFAGAMDDIAVFSRALTATEESNLFNGFVRRKVILSFTQPHFYSLAMLHKDPIA